MQTLIRPLIIGTLVLLLTVIAPTCAAPFPSIASSGFAQMYEPSWESVDRRRTPAWFSEARFGIFIHQSQKDMVPFQGSDTREFWQRAEDRNAGTADLYARLGLTKYAAVEAFVRYHY